MSNLSVHVSMSASKNGGSVSDTLSYNADMTGDKMIGNVQTVGFAAAEALLLGDVATPGDIMIRNLDPTNFVEVALDDQMANKLCKIRPGRAALFEPVDTSLFIKADTAAVDVRVSAADQ